MDVERCLDRNRGFEDGPELPVVEVFSIRMRVDDQSVQLQLRDGPFDFFCRSPGVLWSKAGERGKPCRMSSDGVGQLIVRIAGNIRCGIGIEHLDAWRGQRQHVNVHAGLVHERNPLGVEVKKPPQQGSVAW